MDRKEKENRLVSIFTILAVVMLAAIIIAWLVTGASQKNKEADIPSLPTEADNHTILIDSSGFGSDKSVIDTTVIKDGLNDMGVLITEEYYFTEVVNFSSTKQLFNIDISFTESSYIGSYDGYVTAGLDFSGITVSESGGNIKVKLPKATVQSVVIDPDSFILYSEKSGFANRLSASDFNGSLVELNKTAEEKAIEKGILDRADENAKKLIETFIGGLIDTSEYTVTFVDP